MNLKPWKRQDPITSDRLNAMQGAIPTIRGGGGIGVGSANGTNTISVTQTSPVTKWTFWAFIDDNASVGPNQWEYFFTEAIKVGPGYAGWQPRTDGRIGVAYNLAEVPNDGAGDEGNGIDMANLPSGFSMQPFASGVPVLLTVLLVPDGLGGSVYEYWFHGYNAVDGECEAQP